VHEEGRMYVAVSLIVTRKDVQVLYERIGKVTRLHRRGRIMTSLATHPISGSTNFGETQILSQRTIFQADLSAALHSISQHLTSSRKHTDGSIHNVSHHCHSRWRRFKPACPSLGCCGRAVPQCPRHRSRSARYVPSPTQ
jgi:hypothetical protein